MSSKKRAYSWGFILAFGIGGVFLGRWLGGTLMRSAEFGFPFGSSLGKIPSLFLLLCLVAVAYYLAIFLHEWGHLLVGLLYGFRFGAFIVGPFKVSREQSRLRFQLKGGFNLLGGFTLMAMPQRGELARLMFRMVAGGPLASFIMVLLCGILFIALGGPHSLTAETAIGLWITQFILGLLVLFNALITGISLWPRQIGLVLTDGARLQVLARPGPRREAEIAFLRLYQGAYNGIPPRQYDTTQLDHLLASEDQHPYGNVARLYYYYHHLELGNLEEARPWLRQAVVNTAHEHLFTQQLFTLEWAFHNTLWGTEDSQPYWPERIITLIEPGTKARYLAAKALTEGDTESALQYAQQAQKLIPHQLDRGAIDMELALVEAIMKQLKTSLAV